MQDKIVLGILQYGDMTSYGLKKTIEKSTALFYNASMGSIHPALKKLESSGYINANSTVENGRAKKIYSITKRGRDYFSAWLSEGLPLGKFRDETLVRLFFFGHLKINERRKNILNHIALLNEQVEILEILKKQITNIDIAENMKSHAQFQMATLEFGLAYFKFARNWYQKYFEDNLK